MKSESVRRRMHGAVLDHRLNNFPTSQVEEDFRQLETTAELKRKVRVFFLFFSVRDIIIFIPFKFFVEQLGEPFALDPKKIAAQRRQVLERKSERAAAWEAAKKSKVTGSDITDDAGLSTTFSSFFQTEADRIVVQREATLVQLRRNVAEK